MTWVTILADKMSYAIDIIILSPYNSNTAARPGVTEVTLLVFTQICQDLSGVLEHSIGLFNRLFPHWKISCFGHSFSLLLDNLVRIGYSVLIILLVSYK